MIEGSSPYNKPVAPQEGEKTKSMAALRFCDVLLLLSRSSAKERQKFGKAAIRVRRNVGQ